MAGQLSEGGGGAPEKVEEFLTPEMKLESLEGLVRMLSSKVYKDAEGDKRVSDTIVAILQRLEELSARLYRNATVELVDEKLNRLREHVRLTTVVPSDLAAIREDLVRLGQPDARLEEFFTASDTRLADIESRIETLEGLTIDRFFSACDALEPGPGHPEVRIAELEARCSSLEVSLREVKMLPLAERVKSIEHKLDLFDGFVSTLDRLFVAAPPEGPSRPVPTTTEGVRRELARIQAMLEPLSAAGGVTALIQKLPKLETSLHHAVSRLASLEQRLMTSPMADLDMPTGAVRMSSRLGLHDEELRALRSVVDNHAKDIGCFKLDFEGVSKKIEMLEDLAKGFILDRGRQESLNTRLGQIEESFWALKTKFEAYLTREKDSVQSFVTSFNEGAKENRSVLQNQSMKISTLESTVGELIGRVNEVDEFSTVNAEILSSFRSKFSKRALRKIRKKWG